MKKGDFLAQIDPRPYQVALAQAEGQLAKDRATLRNSEVDLARYRTLLAQNSIARQTVDTQAALVQQNQGTIAADQAQVDAQKLNLTFARIVSPISGRVGLRRVDPGNYVQTSDPNGIVVITQIHPISVIFTLPGDDLPAVMRRMRSGAALAVTAFDRTGTTRLANGTLETVDNQIDTTTGMVKLRALFDNADEALFANQFVTVQLLLDTMRDKPVIPAAAVQRGAPGTFVYLVKPDDTVAVQPVKLGPSSGERVALARRAATGADRRHRWRRPAARRRQGAGRASRPARRTAAPHPNPNGRAANAGGAANDPAALRPARSPAPTDADAATSALHQAAGRGLVWEALFGNRGAMREPVTRFHPAPGRDVAADGGNHAGRRDRVSAASGIGSAGSRLSDNPGHDTVSRRKPGRDGVLGDRAARSAARADAGAQSDELGQLGRRIGHYPAVQSVPEPRHCRAAGPGGDQRGRQSAAFRPADAADLRQGQSGRCADPDLGADLGDNEADPAR